MPAGEAADELGRDRGGLRLSVLTLALPDLCASSTLSLRPSPGSPTSYLVLALRVVLPCTPQPGPGLQLFESSAPDAATCRRVPTRLPPPSNLRPHVPSGDESSRHFPNQLRRVGKRERLLNAPFGVEMTCRGGDHASLVVVAATDLVLTGASASRASGG